MQLIKSIDLRSRLESCPTGTTIFCRTKNDLECSLIRTILKSYWNHTAVVFWMNGELYIVEATFNDVIRPKRFDLWLAERWYDDFGISECEVPDHLITNFFSEKPVRYDVMSVMVYMLIYQLTGWWFGRVAEKASKRMFCFEFSALIRNLPLWWRIVPKDFPGEDEVLNNL